RVARSVLIMLQFGRPDPVLDHRRRPTAFGLVMRDGLLACVRVERGAQSYFDLPGGALDGDETEAQALARDAAAEGASGLLLAPVSYTPLTEEEVFQHFLAVASATDLPLCIYSNPGTTNFTFRPELVARLAAIPTVAAIKLPLPASGDIAADLAAFRQAAPGLSVGYSGDWGCKAALLAGADCWYSVAGGLFPEQAAALAAAAVRGDREEADRCDAAFAGMWNLFRAHGSLRLIYAVANMLGLTETQPPKPLLGPDAMLKASLLKALPR
ncbi:hypothetical protein LTR94_028361, partial [Friedmanniomyces endolithicus]